MLKRILKFGFISIILSASVYLVYNINTTIKDKEDLAIHLQSIPSFNLKNLKGAYIKDRDLKGKKSIIIYYGIDCSFCESEAVQLQNNKEKIAEYNVLMVSQNTLEEQSEFRDRFDLKEENFHFAYDEDQSFLNSYGIAGTPTILLYDQNGMLLKKLTGSASMDIILKYLRAE